MPLKRCLFWSRLSSRIDLLCNLDTETNKSSEQTSSASCSYCSLCLDGAVIHRRISPLLERPELSKLHLSIILKSCEFVSSCGPRRRRDAFLMCVLPHFHPSAETQSSSRVPSDAHLIRTGWCSFIINDASPSFLHSFIFSHSLLRYKRHRFT